jgi:hypothetical protein
MIWRAILGTALALGLAIPAAAQQVAQVQQTRTLVPADENPRARFTDIMDIDQEGHMLYFGDGYRGGVDIFDVSGPNPVYVKTVSNEVGTGHGIIVAKNVNKVFVGEGVVGVGVIDIDPASRTFNTQVATIPTGGSADEIDYDAVDMKIYIAHRNEGFLGVIDAVNNVLVGEISGLGPILEQPRYNAGDGYLYQISGGDNVVYRIDPKTDTVLATFDIGDPCAPNGLAINPKTNQAVLGCARAAATPHTAFFDLTAGRLIGTTQDVGYGDSAIYNAKADRFFFGASDDPRGPMMGIYTGTPIGLLTTVPTTTYSHAEAFDETNNMIYTLDIQNGRPALLSFPLPAR